MVRKVISINEWPTETLYFPPVSTPPLFSPPNPPNFRPIHLVFIPGNPGTVLFYVEMLNRLRNYLSNGDSSVFPSNNLHIHAISYAGHGSTSRLITGGYQEFHPDTHSLAGQIEHK